MNETEQSRVPLESYFVMAEAAIARLECAVREERPASVAACAAHLASESIAAGAELVAPIAAELARRANADDLDVAAHLVAALERALVQTETPTGGAHPSILAAAPPPQPPAATREHGTEGRPGGLLDPIRAPGDPASAPWRPASRWSAWIPLAALLALCVLAARLFSPTTLSGSATYAATGVLALALGRLVITLVEDRHLAATMRATLATMQAGELALALLFEHNPQPMWVYDRETLRILAVSEAAVASYGYSREEFRAMRITDLRAPEDVPSLFDFLDNARGPSRLGFDAADPWRHMRRDGSVIEVEISSDGLLFQGRECRIVVSQDVTERNRATAELACARDEAVEASNLKSAFLATMSHEMRTPMQGVIGMNEMLLGTPLTGEQRDYAEQISQSSEQMLAIVEDILDISALESRERELSIERFDLHSAIEQACVPARVEAGAKGLLFDLAIEPGVPRLHFGDREKLRRAVSKLVANGVKFSDEGLVVVRVGADPSVLGSEDARIRIAVSDTGVGIEPGSLERMFEPFVQADRSTTRQYGGVGLGLAIARELIELMGGVLCAESEPGRGSTFWFELNLRRANRPASEDPPPSQRPPRRRASRTPLVLVAEDSHINQIAAVRALRRYGCRVDVVADGDEALQALALKHYDAVLMDCNMPRLNGYEATARLRRGEHGRHTPVIAMTASELAGDEQRLRAAGIDASISKPMRPETLRETLERWIPNFGEGDEERLAAARRVPVVR